MAAAARQRTLRVHPSYGSVRMSKGRSWRNGPAPDRMRGFVRPRTREIASRMRIAMLAPPWIPVPAPGYGGIEAVVEVLCNRLVADRHDVTLFAAPGSRSP